MRSALASRVRPTPLPKRRPTPAPQEETVDDCDGCALWTNRGPNMVPWGNTMVNEGDYWECSEGHVPGDCPFVSVEPHYGVRSYNRQDEEDCARGDYEREKWL